MCNGSCTCDMTDASIEQLAWPQRLGFGLSDTLGFMCEIFWMMEVITGILTGLLQCMAHVRPLITKWLAIESAIGSVVDQSFLININRQLES